MPYGNFDYNPYDRGPGESAGDARSRQLDEELKKLAGERDHQKRIDGDGNLSGLVGRDDVQTELKYPRSKPSTSRVFLRLIGVALLFVGGILSISTAGAFFFVGETLIEIIPNIILTGIFLGASLFMFRLASH